MIYWCEKCNEPVFDKKLHELTCKGKLKKLSEVLHEEFVDQCIDEDSYLKQMFDYVRHFDEEQDGDALKEGIEKFINK